MALGLFDFFKKKKERISVSASFSWDNPESVERQLCRQEINTPRIKYIGISTSGDEHVCPMCAQFEGKIFYKDLAPKLPLCPCCGCAYIYYFDDSDLPMGCEISDISNFTLPAKCVSLFHEHWIKILKEIDTDKIIEMCESDLKRLSELMKPYKAAGFSAPDTLVCRDRLPWIYMYLGEWNKAELAIRKCIEAGAYYPNDGAEELSYLLSYKEVVQDALDFIKHNAGFQQRKLYNALGYVGEKREMLIDFLRNNKIFKKEKEGNTNKLYYDELPEK